MDLEIKKLDPSMTDDFLYFFDDIAFCDNPDWADCYCCFFYFPSGRGWEQRTGEQKREYAASRIEDGRLNGFIAYVDGKPAGWVNADDISNYERILADDDIPQAAAKKAGAIVCFVIDHRHRGRGIASALLEAACDDFIRQGFDVIEAYPRKKPENEASKYHGTVAMYERNGFAITGEADDFYIVRRHRI